MEKSHIADDKAKFVQVIATLQKAGASTSAAPFAPVTDSAAGAAQNPPPSAAPATANPVAAVGGGALPSTFHIAPIPAFSATCSSALAPSTATAFGAPATSGRTPQQAFGMPATGSLSFCRANATSSMNNPAQAQTLSQGRARQNLSAAASTASAPSQQSSQQSPQLVSAAATPAAAAAPSSLARPTPQPALGSNSIPAPKPARACTSSSPQQAQTSEPPISSTSSVSHGGGGELAPEDARLLSQLREWARDAKPELNEAFVSALALTLRKTRGGRGCNSSRRHALDR
eukprot:5478490-Pleurochrysis_carterae.AAC.1